MAILDPFDPIFSTFPFTLGVIYGTRYADVLTGTSGSDTIYGGGGNDLINGAYDHDTIFGNSGDDTLIGGYGNDLLRGGPGRDTFKYNLATDSSSAAFYPGDTIVDFSSVDFIDLSRIDANPGLAGNQAFRFVGQVSDPNVYIGTGQVGVYLGDRGGIEVIAKADKDMRITLQGTWSINSGQIIL